MNPILGIHRTFFSSSPQSTKVYQPSSTASNHTRFQLGVRLTGFKGVQTRFKRDSSHTTQKIHKTTHDPSVTPTRCFRIERKIPQIIKRFVLKLKDAWELISRGFRATLFDVSKHVKTLMSMFFVISKCRK